MPPSQKTPSLDDALHTVFKRKRAVLGGRPFQNRLKVLLVLVLHQLLHVLLDHLAVLGGIVVDVARAVQDRVTHAGGQVAPRARPVRLGTKLRRRVGPVRVVRLLRRVVRVLRPVGLLLVLLFLLLVLLPLTRAA